MRVYLHIGTEKTGTTTIQQYIYHNRNKLREKGFYILTSPGKGNNRGLSSFAMRKNRFDDYHADRGISTQEDRIRFDENIYNDAVNEIKSLDENIHSVIISSEHFQSRCIHLDEIKNIYNFLSGLFHEITVIVYLRPQVDVATSLYSTVLRGNCRRRFKNFILHECRSDNYYYNYFSLLSQWEKVFGRNSIKPRIFEKSQFKNSNLLDDFFDIIGADRKGLNEISNQNESLTPFGQEILRLNNEYRYKNSIKKFDNFYFRIKELVNKNHIGKGCSLNSKDAESIQEKFNHINSSVANKWFGAESLFEIDFSKYGDGMSISSSELDILEFLFSYQFDIQKKDSEASKTGKVHGHGVDFLSSKEVDAIRDSALILEKTHPEFAYALMKAALKLRPNGEFIRKKVEEYCKGK